MKHHFGTWSVLFTVHLYSWDHWSQSVQFPTFAYHQFFSQSYMHRPNSAFNTLGGEVYYADCFCSFIFLVFQNHPLVTFWISPSHFTGVATTQLWWFLSKRNVIQRIKRTFGRSKTSLMAKLTTAALVTHTHGPKQNGCHYVWLRELWQGNCKYFCDFFVKKTHKFVKNFHWILYWDFTNNISA